MLYRKQHDRQARSASSTVFAEIPFGVLCLALVILFLSLFSPCQTQAAILTVGNNVADQYSSIQEAINYCQAGDIVQVRAGVYYEHLDTMGKSITIRSWYVFTQSEDTIQNTVIHASFPYACLNVHNLESVIIDGFTLTNNQPEVLNYPPEYDVSARAGGIEVYEGASIQITNCVIRNCFSMQNGGVFFNGVNFFMSNTKVFECYGIEGAGGILLSGAGMGSIIFDPVNPNSIYNNTATVGMDIALGYLHQPLSLALETGSVLLTVQDWFWLWTDNSQTVSVSVQNAWFDLVDADLYVSWEGSDSNSGLSPQQPLKTLAQAIRIIEPDSLHVNTIHMAVGEYDFSGSNQWFPLNVKSHTRIIGDDPDFVVFNAEETRRACFRVNMQKNVCIENITFIPHLHAMFRASLEAYGSENIELRNLHWNGGSGYNSGSIKRIDLKYCDGIICENISAQNASNHMSGSNTAIEMVNCRNAYLNNILMNNLIQTWDSFNNCLNLRESDVSIRNSVLSNCFSNGGVMLEYRSEQTTGISLDMSNTLFINNRITSPFWGAPIYISSLYERSSISNCTFAQSDATGARIMRIKGVADISNCIFHNPDNFSDDLILANVNSGITYAPTVSFSLLTKRVVAQDSTAVGLNDLIIGEDPQFMNSSLPWWDEELASSYTLASGSPCINAGTPDIEGMNLPPMDLAGNYRIWDGRIDMGCYEYGSEPYVSSSPPDTLPIQDIESISIYPNPVRISEGKAYAYIEFSLPRDVTETPEVEIFNVRGQKVYSEQVPHSRKSLLSRVRLDDVYNKGSNFYSTVFDCRNSANQALKSGIYLIRVRSGVFLRTGKFTVYE